MAQTPSQVQTLSQAPSLPQAQAQGRRIVGPIPVRVVLDFDYVEKRPEGARLVRLQWRQPYSNRFLVAPVIKADPALLQEKEPIAILEVWEEPRMWWSEERRIPAKERGVTKRTIIKLYRPYKMPNSVQYVFAALEFPVRYTRMGGEDRTELVRVEDELWRFTATNMSRSGRHGKVLYVVLARRAVFSHVTVSNRGNVSEEVIVVTPEGLKVIDRYEELETVKAWCYGRAVMMRDNLTGSEFLALVLDWHVARKSAAETRHEIEPEDAVELLWTTGHVSKTHWTEVYKVVRTPVTLRTVRISGSGRKLCEEEVVIQ